MESFLHILICDLGGPWRFHKTVVPSIYRCLDNHLQWQNLKNIRGRDALVGIRGKCWYRIPTISCDYGKILQTFDYAYAIETD